MFKKAVSFFKENTLRAVFSSIVTIIIVSAIGFIKSVRESILDFLLFIIKKEYFYICAAFAVVCLLLHRRVRNLEKGLSKGTSGLDAKAAPVRGFEYFFSGNANWKINLARKSFNRNPYCACCEPPSALLALGPSLAAFEFFTTHDTHECAKTNKRYSIRDNAYLIAYLGAKEEYGINNPGLEKELEKMRSQTPKPT